MNRHAESCLFFYAALPEIIIIIISRWWHIQRHFSEVAPQFIDLVFCGLLSYPSLLLRDSASLRSSFFNHIIDLPPIHPISCNMFLQLFLFSTIYVSNIWLPCPNFFKTCCCHQIQDELIFLRKQFIYTFNIWWFLCSIWNKVMICEICKSFHSVFIYILHHIPTFVWILSIRQIKKWSHAVCCCVEGTVSMQRNGELAEG